MVVNIHAFNSMNDILLNKFTDTILSIDINQNNYSFQNWAHAESANYLILYFTSKIMSGFHNFTRA